MGIAQEIAELRQEHWAQGMRALGLDPAAQEQVIARLEARSTAAKQPWGHHDRFAIAEGEPHRVGDVAVWRERGYPNAVRRGTIRGRQGAFRRGFGGPFLRVEDADGEHIVPIGDLVIVELAS